MSAITQNLNLISLNPHLDNLLISAFINVTHLMLRSLSIMCDISGAVEMLLKFIALFTAPV